MNLSDLPADAVARGHVLTRGDALDAVTMAEADLAVLPRVPQPLEDYAEVHVHVGTAEAMAHVAILQGRTIAPGESRPVQLRLEAPVAVAPGDRFIVRGSVAGLAGGQVTTLGGGRILGTSDVRLRRQRPWTLDHLAARRDALDSPQAWAAVILREAGEPLSREELARRARLQADAVDEALARLREAGTVRDADGGRWLHADVIASAAEAVVQALEAFHADHPLRQGMEEDALRRAADLDAAVFRPARDDLLAAGRVERRGTVLGLAGQGARLSAEDAALKSRIAEAYASAGLEPPDAETLAADLGDDGDRVAGLVRLLVDEGTLVAVGEDLVMHAEAVERAKDVAVDLFARAGGFSTVEFRDALGTSRKFAVPLLDYFDTLRLTVRKGSRRTPGAEAKKRLG